MDNIKQYIQSLFANRKIQIQQNRTALFESFMQDENVINTVKQIFDNQKKLMQDWSVKERIADISQQHLAVPNATVGKSYEALLNKDMLKWDDVIILELKGLEKVGFNYNNESLIIKGTPAKSGDIKCTIVYKLANESDDVVPHEKPFVLIINPDPKTLWKTIPSNKDDRYWKEDEVALFDTLNDKHFVAASKRGRSHANMGSFRDDDFAYKHLENTGWNIIAVADGAGSAPLSRQGSRIACKAVIDFFSEYLTSAIDAEFQTILTEHQKQTTEETQKRISQFVYNHLSKAAYYAHQQLTNAALQAEANLKDFHTTLIFTLFKKFSVGYAFLSFGVGDCPIALLNKNMTEVTMMNWLDVGEFGGGTRFITMPEIFTSDKFSSRFRFKLADDFSYLMMMTDGVYDAKFVVEANLEKIINWKAFIEDIEGKNEDGISVQFDKTNSEIASQLSAGMDFWSADNHDDRTLAIVF